MSIAIAHIPAGFSASQKRILIEKTKKACMEGFGVPEDHSFVTIQETQPENMDATSETMMCLFVYTTYGKSIHGKNKICRGFEEACTEAFGERKKRTIVIFKEHTDENAGANGTLRPLKPGAV